MARSVKEEMTPVTKKFCEDIEAEWLFCNEDSFGFMSINGNLYHIYWDELETILKNPNWKEDWKQK